MAAEVSQQKLVYNKLLYIRFGARRQLVAAAAVFASGAVWRLVSPAGGYRCMRVVVVVVVSVLDAVENVWYSAGMVAYRELAVKRLEKKQ